MTHVRYLSSEDLEETAFALPEIAEMQISVRVDNTVAERQYISLGFVEKNVVHPYENAL
jgi:ribosomal protein S18 acetylase RimI-like enzyme